MWLSVAFPTCPRCRENSNKCYHKDCPKGGNTPMEINSNTSYVRCPSCNKTWPIKESNYYCSCGFVFTAEDVAIEVEAIVANAKLIAQEMKRVAETQTRIREMTNYDIEVKAEKTLKKKFGEGFWETIKGLLPAIVIAVKAWLNID